MPHRQVGSYNLPYIAHLTLPEFGPGLEACGIRLALHTASHPHFQVTVSPQLRLSRTVEAHWPVYIGSILASLYWH